MEWRLFADLADAAGERRVGIEADGLETIGDALDALLEAHPALEDRVLDDDGELADHVNVLRNGESVTARDGLATPVEAEDELALFPPVSGGYGLNPAGSGRRRGRSPARRRWPRPPAQRR